MKEVTWASYQAKVEKIEDLEKELSRQYELVSQVTMKKNTLELELESIKDTPIYYKNVVLEQEVERLEQFKEEALKVIHGIDRVASTMAGCLVSEYEHNRTIMVKECLDNLSGATREFLNNHHEII